MASTNQEPVLELGVGSVSPEALGQAEGGGSTEHSQEFVGEEGREVEAAEAINSFPRGPQEPHELAQPLLVLVACALYTKFPDCLHPVPFPLTIFSCADPSVGNSFHDICLTNSYSYIKSHLNVIP